MEIDPQLQNRIHPERWNQMVREGDVTPAWLVADFNVARRRATIVPQLIKLTQKLTDDAVTMFCKLIGRLFSQANNRKKQRRTDAHHETAKALRLFRDTLRALVAADQTGAVRCDALRCVALDIIDRQVG